MIVRGSCTASAMRLAFRMFIGYPDKPPHLHARPRHRDHAAPGRPPRRPVRWRPGRAGGKPARSGRVRRARGRRRGPADRHDPAAALPARRPDSDARRSPHGRRVRSGAARTARRRRRRQFNIVNRIGGALRAAVFALAIDHGMSAGPAAALDRAFVWQLAAAAAATLGTALLWRVQRPRSRRGLRAPRSGFEPGTRRDGQASRHGPDPIRRGHPAFSSMTKCARPPTRGRVPVAEEQSERTYGDTGHQRCRKPVESPFRACIGCLRTRRSEDRGQTA